MYSSHSDPLNPIILIIEYSIPICQKSSDMLPTSIEYHSADLHYTCTVHFGIVRQSHVTEPTDERSECDIPPN